MRILKKLILAKNATQNNSGNGKKLQYELR